MTQCRFKFLPLVIPEDVAVNCHFGNSVTHVKYRVLVPFIFFSESSEEESSGEKEEEIADCKEVTSSTKTTEISAEQTSNTQTGEG